VELQENLESLNNAGVQPYAISYDSKETLAKFAEKRGITYSLLSDTDSRVIRNFGILNTLVAEDHRWFGVPFPGTYMVNESGRVFDRSFYSDHGLRDSIASMLTRSFSITGGVRGTVQIRETDSIMASAWLSSDTVRRGQIHTLTVDIDVKPGFHIYGQPLPTGYIATALRTDELEQLTCGPPIYPKPQSLLLPALGETLSVYSGSISITLPVQSRRRDAFTLKAILDYQACTEWECLLPDTLDFSFPLTYLENP
jgi:hypothetical protein